MTFKRNKQIFKIGIFFIKQNLFISMFVNFQVVCNLLESRSPPGIFECIDEISIIYAKVGRILNLQVVCNLLENRSPPAIFECIDKMQYHLCQGRKDCKSPGGL